MFNDVDVSGALRISGFCANRCGQESPNNLLIILILSSGTKAAIIFEMINFATLNISCGDRMVTCYLSPTLTNKSTTLAFASLRLPVFILKIYSNKNFAMLSTHFSKYSECLMDFSKAAARWDVCGSAKRIAMLTFGLRLSGGLLVKIRTV